MHLFLRGFQPTPYKVESKLVDEDLQQQSLPPADIRIVQVTNVLERFGVNLNNPRFNAAFKDWALDLMGFNQNGNKVETKEKWLGVVERAEQLGYPVALVTKYRITLGKFVKSHGHEFKEEVRLCNGTERPIKLYKQTEDLDNTIKEYMNTKHK